MLAISLFFVFISASPAPVVPPSGEGAMAPRLTSSAGSLILSWMEPSSMKAKKDGKAMRMLTSSFDGKRWTAAEIIVERPDVFANWADFPSVTASHDGTLYAHWLQKRSDKKYAYDVHLARRHRGRWQPMGTLHNDGVAAEHGFLSAVPLTRGVRFFWLDGRLTAAEGPMTLRTARVVGKKIMGRALVDDKVCDCCGTAAAATSEGARVVYRDRSDEEIRDLYSSAVVKDKPSRATAVHNDAWKMPGCPVNGPAFVSAPKGNKVSVAAWYTQGGGKPSVRAAFLPAGAKGFQSPIVVAGKDTLGRVDIVLDGQDALVSSLTQAGEIGIVHVRRVAMDGRVGAAVEVGRTAASRKSGFPQIEILGNELITIWTEVDGDKTSLRASRIRTSDVPPVTTNALLASLASKATTADKGDPATIKLPDLALTDKSGQAAPLLKGKVTIVHLWATWCAPCLKEMPALLKVLRPQARAGHQVALISVDEPGNHERAKALAKGWGASDLLRFDAKTQTEAALGWTVLPMTFVFAPDGKLLQKWTGTTPLPPLKAAIRRAAKR